MNLSRNDLIFLVIGFFVSLMLIKKFGILAYLLIVALYVVFVLILFEWDVSFNPKNPYKKLDKLLRGCFSLDNATWMDSSLDDEFSALEHFCKNKKLKVTLYLDQVDALASVYNSSSDDSDEYKGAVKAFSRIESLQKLKLIKTAPKLPVPKKNPEPIKQVFEGTDEMSGNIGIYYETPLPPKIPSAKMKYFNALTKYTDNCKVTAYVSEDAELRVRVRNFMQENPDKKIEIIPIKDFKKSAAYINRFKIKLIETSKKKKKASTLKWKNRGAQLQEFMAALNAIKKR